MGNEPGTAGSARVMPNHQQYARRSNGGNYRSNPHPSSPSSQRARGSSSNTQNSVNTRNVHRQTTTSSTRQTSQNASHRRSGRASRSDDDFKNCSPHSSQQKQLPPRSSHPIYSEHNQLDHGSSSVASINGPKFNNAVLSDSSTTSNASVQSATSSHSAHSKTSTGTQLNNSKSKASVNAKNSTGSGNNKIPQNVSFRLSTKLCPDDVEILKCIGKGSFGVVFQVKMKKNQKIYAMKRLNKKDLVARKQVAHTNTERRVLANIDHPFIVSLRFAFQTKSKLYMLMDYHCGGELFFHLQKEGKFSESRSRFYAAEICLAIECLHRKGITYRDLKPENILLDFDGHIKITDFGLSKEVTSSPDSITRTFCGSPEYLAPEMLLQKGYDHGVDWWAFGTIVYEMLVGTPPFYCQDIQRMYQNILTQPVTFYQGMSRESMLLIQGLLEKEPINRWRCRRIKECSFFRPIDWNKLYRKGVEPPVRPQVLSESDTQNFEQFSVNSKSNKHGTYLMQTPSFASHSLLAAQDQFPNFTYDETQDKALQSIKPSKK